MLRTIVVCLAALAAAPAALALSPAPGDYETAGGSGSLSITTDKHGAQQFQIESTGANGHVCSLNGRLKGSTGYAAPWSDGSEQPCVLTFKQVPHGLEVSAEDQEACRAYCGARAWFEGTYVLPPAGCKPDERRERRSSFTALYRAQDYGHAYETLNAYYGECGKLLHWIELDDVRNDLAITQYHLGHNAECLHILRDTRAAKETSEGQLSLPPADLDAYLPVARATWYNLKLCGKAPAR